MQATTSATSAVDGLTADLATLNLEREAKRAAAIEGMRSFGKKLADKIDTAPLLSLSDKKRNLSIFIQGLINLIKSGICHGDIKPGNILCNDKEFVIADFGGSFKISDLTDRIHKVYLFSGELEKQNMQKVVNAFRAAPLNPQKIADMRKRYPEQVEKLKSWKIIKNLKKDIPDIRNAKKLAELQEYMRIQPVPAKSDGYACNQYTDAFCNYFWRGDKKNFELACNAFDIRATGITIYSVLSLKSVPRNENDDKYYEAFAVNLQAAKISEKAISLIRRMAQPMKNVDTSPGKVFPLPVSLEELVELKAEMLASI